MNGPLVSVIMPVYNAEKFLADAIDSVLSQTHSDLEFLIFDDGSTDSSASIIASYATKDERIIPTYATVNSGYVKHLNDGILRSRGEFIARMDGDDISMPERFSIQLNFLNENPRVIAVGTASTVINADGAELHQSGRIECPVCLRWQSFFVNPLAHPTVMFRRSRVMQLGLYNVERMPAEDYDLWTRLARVGDIANVNVPLLKYREHISSVSKVKAVEQKRNSIRAQQDHWWSFCKLQLSESAILVLKSLHKKPMLMSPSSIREAYYAILRLYFISFRRTGFVRYIEGDAFDKLYYLAAAASRTRGRLASIEFFGILILTFPFRLTAKLLRGSGGFAL